MQRNFLALAQASARKLVALLFLSVAGCSTAEPVRARVSPSMAAWAHAVDEDARRDEWRTAYLDARTRYVVGDMPASANVARAAFRKVCLEEEAERETALSEQHDHAIVHAAEWSEWYARNCNPTFAVSLDGYVVLSRETGQSAHLDDVLGGLLAVCLADAGLPPARVYEPTGAELLARQRRDACDAAQ